jgi:hypothetical protein
MLLTSVKKFFFVFCCLLFLFKKSEAQTITYSSQNVFTDNPDRLQLVGNIGGNHHLVSFINNSNPVVHIFDADLVFRKKISIPVKYPERSEALIIPSNDFYYLYIHPRFTSKYLLWKIDSDGNATDLTTSFKKLLQSQLHNVKLGFQLIVNRKQLCMVYNTDITNVEKSTMVIVRTDTLLNIISENKVMYDLNRDEERLQQQALLESGDLLILKTAQGETSLQLMKVNTLTGYTVTNAFKSSGYFYSQAGFHYNISDSTITVYSLLTEPALAKRRQFIFISRLDELLVEQVPFTILRSQFLKNESSNFLLVDGSSKWMRFRLSTERFYYGGDSRFTLLDKKFNIINDSLVRNNKNSYTIRADQFYRFTINDNDHMLLAQRFFKKANGLIMINSENANLVYTNIRANDRYNYLLQQSVPVVPKSIVIPYTFRKEAGLIKITID